MRLSLVLLAVLTTACSGVRGSGTAQTEMRELGACPALSVGGAARREVSRGRGQPGGGGAGGRASSRMKGPGLVNHSCSFVLLPE